MDIYYIMSLFNYIPLEVKLWLSICVMPILCLMLDDLRYRGKTGLFKD